MIYSLMVYKNHQNWPSHCHAVTTNTGSLGSKLTVIISWEMVPGTTVISEDMLLCIVLIQNIRIRTI